MANNGMRAKLGYWRFWWRHVLRRDARSRLHRYSSDRDAFLTGMMEGAALAMLVGLPVGFLVLWLGGWLP